ncbi:MAG: metallophosphoesterase [Chthonomonadales bacterium]
MPLSMPTPSRREFLRGAAVSVAGILTLSQSAFAAAGVDPDFIALLSDTHIAADQSTINLKTNMADNLKAVGKQLTNLPLLPTSTIITGDCAYLTAQAGDYATLASLVEPIGAAGHSLTYLMGNHDNRERFRASLNSVQKAEPLEGKHVTRIECKKANLIVLDTLDKTNVTPGVLGDAQLKWLETALDMDKTKPTIVMMHHNPELDGKAGGGLTETKALFDILVPRRQVKMVVFGHTHHVEFKTHEGIHLVNLPPVAYPFDEKDPSGWVSMHLAKKGVDLTIHALNGHKMDGKSVLLDWRV